MESIKIMTVAMLIVAILIGLDLGMLVYLPKILAEIPETASSLFLFVGGFVSCLFFLSVTFLKT